MAAPILAKTSRIRVHHFPSVTGHAVLGRGERGGSTLSLLMLGVVALFPVALLAILLLTSGLEERFVSPHPAKASRTGDQSQPRDD